MHTHVTRGINILDSHNNKDIYKHQLVLSSLRQETTCLKKRSNTKTVHIQEWPLLIPPVVPVSRSNVTDQHSCSVTNPQSPEKVSQPVCLACMTTSNTPKKLGSPMKLSSSSQVDTVKWFIIYAISVSDDYSFKPSMQEHDYYSLSVGDKSKQVCSH